MPSYTCVAITDEVLEALTRTIKWLRSEDLDWPLNHHVAVLAEWLEALGISLPPPGADEGLRRGTDDVA